MAWRKFLVAILAVGLCGPARADLVSDAQVMIRAKDYAGAASVLNSGDSDPGRACCCWRRFIVLERVWPVMRCGPGR